MRADRKRVIALAWSSQDSRCRALADAVGGRAYAIYPRRLGAGRSVLLRYFASSVVTVYLLLARRPRSVIVQNPPVFPSLLAYVYSRLTGARLVMDTHPAGFGAKGNRQGRMFLPVTRWLGARVDGVLVTVQDFADQVDAWGGRGVIVHEPPLDLRPQESGILRVRPCVLFACVFAQDEPVQAVLDAAHLLPEVDFRITGDPAKANRDLSSASPNVALTGLLPLTAFLQEMVSSDVVLSLTTEPTSVARSGYEATYLQRPLIVSQVPAMKQAFPTALACTNDADSIAEAVRSLLRDPPSEERLQRARQQARRTWEGHEQALKELVDIDGH